MTNIGFQTPPVTEPVKISEAARRLEQRKRRTSIAGGVVMPDRPIWDQFQRIGGALTPVQLSSIIRMADLGYPRQLMDLANDAKAKDGHLQGILNQAEESLAGLDWELQLPDGAKRKEKKAAELVEDHLRNSVSEPFQSCLANQSGSFFYGYAVDEVIWTKQTKKELLLPAAFEHREQRRFGHRKHDGRLVWRDIDMPDDGVDFRTQFPNRFVVATPRVTGDVPTREGYVRVLLWAALCRSWDLTDWLRTGEMAWKPWRIAKYEKMASDEDIEGLVAILDKLASTGSAALPETTQLDIKWPSGSGGSGPTHEALFNVLAQEMSKAVLGQTETTQSSTSSGYAQSKTHYAVRENILAARARHIAAVVTRDIIRPMIELNFGVGFMVPRFVLTTQTPENLAPFGQGVKALSDAGLQMSARWARKKAGMPVELEEDEETFGGTAAPDAAAQDQSGQPGADGAAGGDGTATPTEPNPDQNQGPAEDQTGKGPKK